MNIFQQLRAKILDNITLLAKEHNWPADLPLSSITVELPRDNSHGDAATNAALVLSKPLRMTPAEVAQQLKQALNSLPHLQSIEIAGPGFINLRFMPEFWHNIIPTILKLNTDYGNCSIGNQQQVNIEYVSANPTGPLHIGHARGAVFGDALARLLQKAGFIVTKEYYINDAGAQVDILAKSLYMRYLEALGENIGTIGEGLYPGEYLIQPAQELAADVGDKYRNMKEQEWLPPIRSFALQKMMEIIRSDLAKLGIFHDIFTSERQITKSGKIDAVLKLLEEKNLIYTGILEAPKGKEPEDWEPRPQTLFKSTTFGDDVDRPLKKSDGSWTYFAPDIAYHYDKINRGFNILIDIFGADHGGYVKRMQAAIKALSDNTELHIKLCQLVKLARAGQPVKMSKRAGSFVTISEVIDEVGKDALRFIMLTRKNDAPLTFDLEKVVEQSKDNPVFYVQYAHARCKSVLRNACAEGLTPQTDHLSELTHKAELELIQKIALWPVIVEQAAQAYEPHRIAFYLQDIASLFHAFWNLGNTNESLRFIVINEKVTTARLALVQAISIVIASGLEVLGVEPVEEMR